MIVKRLFDIILVIPGLLIISPILLLCSILILVFMGRPVLYKQLRPGYKIRPFYLYKFRTMRELYDDDNNPLSDKKRLTLLGKILRKTSVDEFPELLNVIKGEMSLIGPRPLLMQYIDKYNSEQIKRHDLPPGITGWAQIHGRNAISWEEKFNYDIWYIKHWSLWLDIKILIITFWKVITIDGINQTGEATVRQFEGSKK